MEQVLTQCLVFNCLNQLMLIIAVNRSLWPTSMFELGRDLSLHGCCSAPYWQLHHRSTGPAQGMETVRKAAQDHQRRRTTRVVEVRSKGVLLVTTNTHSGIYNLRVSCFSFYLRYLYPRLCVTSEYLVIKISFVVKHCFLCF